MSPRDENITPQCGNLNSNNCNQSIDLIGSPPLCGDDPKKTRLSGRKKRNSGASSNHPKRRTSSSQKNDDITIHSTSNDNNTTQQVISQHQQKFRELQVEQEQTYQECVEISRQLLGWARERRGEQDRVFRSANSSISRFLKQRKTENSPPQDLTEMVSAALSSQ